MIRLLATVVEDLRQFARLPDGLLGRVLGWALFGIPSIAVASELGRYERRIDDEGLAPASLWLLRRYYRGLAGTPPGASGVRGGGGLLVVANHPGLGDAMALLGWVARTDIMIVTNTRPFFQVLHALSRRTIQVGADRAGVVRAIRAMVDVLRRGECLVLFAAGRIEPDLAFEPDAGEPLAEWSDLIAALVRAATREAFNFDVLPVWISGVVARGAGRSVFVRAARDREARDRAAALHTFLWRASRKQRVRLEAGRVLSASELAAEPRAGITNAVRAEILRLAEATRPAVAPIGAAAQ